MEFKEAVVAEVTKASPPVTVGAMTLVGVPLSDWVIVLTVVYVLLQIFFILRDKWWRDRESQK